MEVLSHDETLKLPSPPAPTERFAQLAASVAARTYARGGMSVSNEIIRVVLADDHTLVPEGLRLLLRSAPDVAVVGRSGQRHHRTRADRAAHSRRADLDPTCPRG